MRSPSARKTQTSFGPNTAAAPMIVASPDHRLISDQARPFQRSAKAVAVAAPGFTFSPNAQTLSGPDARRYRITPDNPAGSLARLHARPFQCRISGLPQLVRVAPVKPPIHALLLLKAMV